MKNRVLIFLVLFLAFSPFVFAQKVSLNYHDSKLEKIFKEITSQTGFSFTYSKPVVNVDKKTSIVVKNRDLNEVLDKLFKHTSIVYEIKDKKIYLTSKVHSQTDQKKGKRVKIKGTVLDENGLAIIGASIKAKGNSSIGTITDFDGNFELKVPQNTTLEISYIGYISKSLKIDEREKYKIYLEEDNKLLDEVVVVGYGTQKRRQLTSSVATVKSEEFNQGAVSSVYGLVQGKVPGLHISRGTYGGSTVMLRGVSSVNGSQSPLVVIDGVPGASTANLDPNDIESVDVLKDGSAAAIYGTRGTNGVIIITTKTADKDKSKITLNSYVSFSKIAKQPDVLNAKEYLEFDPEAAYDYGCDTDWLRETFNNRTPIKHHHNLSISGGSAKTNYRMSFNYNSSESLVKGKTNEGYGARVNIRHKAFKNKLSIIGNMYTRVSKSNPINYRNMEKAMRMNPTAPLFDPDNPNEFFEPGGDEYNPVAIFRQTKAQDKTIRLGGDVTFSLELFPGLKANMLYAMRPRYSSTKEYDAIDSYHSQKELWSGRAYQRSSNSFDQLLDLSLSYVYEGGKNVLDIVGGYSFDDSKSENMSAENYGFLSDGFEWNNLSQGSWLADGKANMDSNKSMNRLIALFGRVNYSYDDTYLMSLSFRNEGSTKFGKNNKWGFFPAFSFGWRLSNEKFFRSIDWLNDLKLRVGYGVTGNQGFGSYKSQTTIAAVKKGWFYDAEKDSWIMTYGPGRNANPNLKWEKKHEWNLGLDFSLLNNRLSGNIDVYKRITKDLLYDNAAPTPPMLYPTIFSNIGEMTNKGLEIGLHGTPIKLRDFQWDTSLTYSIFSNKLNSLFNELTSMSYLDLESLSGVGYAFRLEEGRGVSQFYGYKFAGFTDEGRWLLLNKEGEKVEREDLVESDKVYLGNGLPKMSLGINNSFRYKDWSLSFFLRGDFLFKILNDKEMQYANRMAYPYNVLKSTTKKHKQLNDAKVYSDYYLENGNYMKLDNITLAYDFRPRTEYIKKIRFYATGENVFCITNYSGIDPELPGDPLTWGLDKKRFYPSTRNFTFGVDITF